jgi:hypothetical protein
MQYTSDPVFLFLDNLAVEVAQLSGYGHIKTLPAFLYYQLEEKLNDPTHGDYFLKSLTTLMTYDDFHYALYQAVGNWYVTTIEDDNNHITVSRFIKDHYPREFLIEWSGSDADVYIQDYTRNFFDEIV